VTERNAFLAAIHAAPEDDAPRLVYSDWLDERGEVERAEFVRTQIEMRREYDAHGRVTPRLDALFLKQKELFQRPWADILRRCGAAAVSTYARGFSTSGFHLTAADFAREAAELVGWFGPQARLVLSGCRGNLSSLVNCEEFRWIYSLTLMRDWRIEDYTDEDLATFCQSPFLDSIRHLHLVGRTRPTNPSGLTAAACQVALRP
jgi:uncharacterized protein (TIGR02996 family)